MGKGNTPSSSSASESSCSVCSFPDPTLSTELLSRWARSRSFHRFSFTISSELESPAPPPRPNWTQRSRLLPSVSSVGHRSPGTSLRNRNTIVSPRTPCTESRGTIGLRSVSPSTNRSPSSSRTNCSSRLVCVSVRLYRFTSGACTCSTTKYSSWSHTVDGKR
uniref:Uncharacterized protein n=1 Tax=Anopheles coluzzii TaxID=1518534 RepID=A0A8W7Q1G8_ANOCL